MFKLDVLMAVMPQTDVQSERKFMKRWGENSKVIGDLLEKNVTEAFGNSIAATDEVIRERGKNFIEYGNNLLGIAGGSVAGTVFGEAFAGPLGGTAFGSIGFQGGYDFSEWVNGLIFDKVDKGDVEAAGKELTRLGATLDWSFDVFKKLPEEVLRGYIKNIVTLENELTSLYAKIDQSETKTDDVLKEKINTIKTNIETNKSRIIDHLNEVVVPHNDSILAIYNQLKGDISDAQIAMRSGFEGVLDEQLESWKENSLKLYKYSVPVMEVIQEKLRILKAEGKGGTTEYVQLKNTLNHMGTDVLSAVSVFTGATKQIEKNTKRTNTAMKGVLKIGAGAVVTITAAAETSEDALGDLGDAINTLPALRGPSAFTELIVPLNDVENAVGGIGAAVTKMSHDAEQATDKTVGFIGQAIHRAQQMADEAAAAGKKAFAQDMVKFVSAFDDEFKKVFGPEATGIINGFVDLFQQAEGDLTTLWDEHWAGVIGLGLNALGQMGGEVGNVEGGVIGGFEELPLAA